MKVYSRSQGKVIETSNAQMGGMGAGAGVSGVGGGGATGGLGIDSEALRTLLGIGALKKGQYTAAGEFLLPEKATESEKNKKQSQKEAEQILTEIENWYFGNKLHYGFTPEGFQKSLQARFNPNSSLGVYNRFVGSKGVSLAKLAGDVGNIAWREQQVQLKALGTGLHNYKSATDQFNLARKGFNLPTRDYSEVSSYKTDINDLINQFGGGTQ